ncbi:MAG: hypothetical protein ACXQTD_05005 [Candidatus Syntropharchaeia archaeon]
MPWSSAIKIEVPPRIKPYTMEYKKRGVKGFMMPRTMIIVMRKRGAATNTTTYVSARRLSVSKNMFWSSAISS